MLPAPVGASQVDGGMVTPQEGDVNTEFHHIDLAEYMSMFNSQLDGECLFSSQVDGDPGDVTDEAATATAATAATARRLLNRAQNQVCITFYFILFIVLLPMIRTLKLKFLSRAKFFVIFHKMNF